MLAPGQDSSNNAMTGDSLCGMLVLRHSLRQGHVTSDLCNANVRLKQKRAQMDAALATNATKFTIDGDELGTVETFKHLGQVVSAVDSDWPALKKNLL